MKEEVLKCLDEKVKVLCFSWTMNHIAIIDVSISFQ